MCTAYSLLLFINTKLIQYYAELVLHNCKYASLVYVYGSMQPVVNLQISVLYAVDWLNQSQFYLLSISAAQSVYNLKKRKGDKNARHTHGKMLYATYHYLISQRLHRCVSAHVCGFL